MYRIGCEWSKRNEAYKARKEEIIEKYGWDSDELKAWYAEGEQMKFPFSGGANKAKPTATAKPPPRCARPAK